MMTAVEDEVNTKRLTVGVDAAASSIFREALMTQGIVASGFPPKVKSVAY